MLTYTTVRMNGKVYKCYIDKDCVFTQKPMLEKSEAIRLMNDINATFVDETEMTYDEKTDNFYDDYRCWDDHTGKDYETENGVRHLYDFAEDYFERWKPLH